MPTNVNYLNPAAFAPQTDFRANSFLGGYIYGNQMDDYRKIMDNQLFLQDLARKQAEMEFGDFQADAPVRDLKRQTDITRMDAELPYIGRRAQAAAETEIAGNNFKRETEFSPQNREDFFRNLRDKADDSKFKTYQRELSAGLDLVNNALAIQKSKSPLLAQGYVDQQLARLRQSGVNLPQIFSQPELWPHLQQAAVQSIQHMQNMEKTKAEIAGRERVATIAANATRDAAAARGGSGNDKLNIDQYITSLSRAVSSGEATPQQQQQLQALLEIKWRKDIVGNSPEMQILELQAMRKDDKGNYTPEAQQARQTYNTIKNQWLGSLSGGLQQQPSAQTPAANAGKPTETVEYKRPEDVRDAFRAGKITREQAEKQLRGQFGWK